MKKTFAFFFLLTAMVSQAASNSGYPVIVPFPITEDPCAVQSEKMTGVVWWFNHIKRSGLITPDDPNVAAVYVSFRGLKNPSQNLNADDKVRFTVARGPGGLHALQVEVIK